MSKSGTASCQEDVTKKFTAKHRKIHEWAKNVEPLIDTYAERRYVYFFCVVSGTFYCNRSQTHFANAKFKYPLITKKPVSHTV